MWTTAISISQGAGRGEPRSTSSTSADPGRHRPGPRSVADVCNATAELYRQYWGEHLHFALFEPGEDENDFDAALERTHQYYLATVAHGDSTRILDVGCGGGAFSEWLAARTDGDVVGIDMSDLHIRRARLRLRHARGNLAFVEQDITCVGSMRNNTHGDAHISLFDAAICLDSACYFANKTTAFRGIAAMLHPGAKILIADRVRVASVTGLQQELLIDPFCQLSGIPRLEPVNSYVHALGSAGFRVLAVNDRTEQVTPNWVRSYNAAERALAEIPDPIRLVSLAANAIRYGCDGASVLKEQFTAALLAKAAADFGVVRYATILAEQT